MENRYPENLRKAAVTKFINGQSAKEVCAEYGIARSTLFLWKKQYTTDKIGQIPREQYLLKKELWPVWCTQDTGQACGTGAYRQRASHPAIDERAWTIRNRYKTAPELC